jgi:hypothetical protein
MSLYALQKLIRDVNRLPPVREAWFADPGPVIARYEVSPEEAAALRARDWTRLYAMGVHGLLLRPFTILHQVSEPDYLRAIRESV